VDKIDFFKLTVSEIGFDIKENKLIFGHLIDYNTNFYKKEGTISAPLWQDAISFLKRKGILVTELWNGWEVLESCETQEEAVLKTVGNEDCCFEYFITIEQAVLKAIEILKNK
jgi:hypothetical protein